MAKRGRPRIDADLTHYSGRVADALRKLRDSKDWSVEQFMEKVAEIACLYECTKCKTRLWSIRGSLSQITESQRCAVQSCRGRCKSVDLEISRRTVFHWERGMHNGGRDIPIDMIPVVAEIYGFRQAADWMP